MHKKISFGEKAALGAGSFMSFIALRQITIMALPVYQIILGLNPALVGLALAIPRLLDAFLDPLMGNLSDNFHSRFGRRRPFIVIGAILSGIAFGLVWMVPEAWSENKKLIYFIGTSFLYYACLTVFSVPNQSLVLEMSPDYDERTKITAYCSFFSKAAELIYQWIFPLTQLGLFATALQGVRTVGWLTGIVLIAVIGVIPGIFVKERYYSKAKRQPRVTLGTSVAAIVRTRSFSVLIALVILTSFAGMMASTFDYYLLVFYVFDGDLVQGSIWKAVLSSEFALVGVSSIWLVLWLSKKFSKHVALRYIYAMAVLGGLLKWFIYVPGHPWLVCIDPLLSAPLWTALDMLQPSMLADVCDEDELNHHQRREGMFGSVFSWIWKCGISLSLLLSGIILALTGFDEQLGGAQPGSTFMMMRIAFAGIPTLSALSCILLLSLYPITRQRAAETRRTLETRRGDVD